MCEVVKKSRFLSQKLLFKFAFLYFRTISGRGDSRQKSWEKFFPWMKLKKSRIVLNGIVLKNKNKIRSTAKTDLPPKLGGLESITGIPPNFLKSSVFESPKDINLDINNVFVTLI